MLTIVQENILDIICQKIAIIFCIYIDLNILMTLQFLFAKETVMNDANRKLTSQD